MAMPLFGIQRQHPVGVISGFDQLGEPKIGDQGCGVPGDQEIRVVVRLGRIEYLCDPTQRLGKPSRRRHVGPESP